MQCDASPAQKFTIAIDLSFEDNMCEIEIRSLCKQVQVLLQSAYFGGITFVFNFLCKFAVVSDCAYNLYT